MAVKTNAISLRRRQLMILGVGTAAIPGALLAGECTSPARGVSGLTAGAEGEKLILSGRVVDADCRPLTNARVELAGSGVATTDADGRFMIDSRVPAEGAVRLRVSRGGRTITRVPGPGARFERDEARVWRTTLGLTFA
jgi:hypothetical protein